MVGEIALTVVLLTAASLLLRSYAAVLAVDPGFTPDRLLVADTELSPSKYADAPRRAAFYATRARARERAARGRRARAT